MRTMGINTQPFYYALFKDKVPLFDDYGNESGEYDERHSSPVPYRGNITAAKGDSETRQFGELLNYDRVIILGKDAPPIDEYSLIWIDSEPPREHDYRVTAIAKSLNSTSIAIQKVTVS